MRTLLRFRWLTFVRTVMAVPSQRTNVGVIYLNRLANILPINSVASTLEQKCASLHVVANLGLQPSETGNVEISPEDIAKLQQAEVIISDPLLFRRLGLNLPNLKWLHCYWAGVEKLTRDLDPSQIPSYILTRNGYSYVEPMAQYVVMHMLMHERHLVDIIENQKAKIWKTLFYRDMATLTLGILGLGAIGRETARLAKTMGMKVWGLVRTLPSPSERCPHVDEYRLTDGLPELLSTCDYVCNILPATAATDGLLDGNMLAHCKSKKSVFMNIGRGNVVQNATILKALDHEWISHAIIDVFESEPLPVDSRLWTHPRSTVTPHVAGVGLHVDKFVDDYIVNFELYKKAEPMNYVVDWLAGY